MGNNKSFIRIWNERHRKPIRIQREHRVIFLGDKVDAPTIRIAKDVRLTVEQHNKLLKHFNVVWEA